MQILVVLMAFTEILGVASVGPFIALVSNPSLVNEHHLFAKAYAGSGLSTPQDFVFWTGIGALALLFFGALISMLTVWRLALFSNRVGSELGVRLYRYYMHQNWLFHVGGSSAQFTKQIATETSRVTNQILNPLMQMNAKIVLAIFMLTGLFLFNPAVTLTAMVMFSIAYVLLYRVVRKILAENGKRISDVSTQRFKLMAEGFGGIKDLLLLGRQHDFVQRFDACSRRLAVSQGTNQSLGQTPRYFMELVAYGAVVLLVLYLQKSYEGNLERILPVLSVYALAGFKLLPAFQNIYMYIAAIKGGMAAFESVRVDLVNSKQHAKAPDKEAHSDSPVHLRQSIVLRDVEFSYPGKDSPALKNFNIHIPVNKTVGLVGSSGSGKSTAIDLLLGLIQPDSGELLIDGKPLNQSQLRGWQDSLGFVPQSIFLSDASILENIAFGLARDAINVERAQRATNLAHLDELVSSFPQGLDTRIGERGVQLSGGQRQRIGIARALYHDAEVLIFDEATSALDGITEKLIMDAIHDFSGKKTMIMIAHRLKTVEKCDIIYFIENGTVVDSGTFKELIEKNPKFKRMADHS